MPTALSPLGRLTCPRKKKKGILNIDMEQQNTN